MTALLIAASLVSPLFVDFAPEVRTSYQSLGKIVEDRPMQVTSVRAGYDAGAFGRFGVRNWDVSSLTDRRADVHRHALYHTEFGPTWDCRLALADGWALANDLTYSWTLYRGFANERSNRTYQWVQVEQSLENPFLVPFCRLRRCLVGNDYLYAKVGVRRKCPFAGAFYVTPSVYWEGGNRRNAARVFGDGGAGGGALTFRVEAGWAVCEQVTAYAFVEQYEVCGADTRAANDALGYACAHNDWTHGGVGVRMRF